MTSNSTNSTLKHSTGLRRAGDLERETQEREVSSESPMTHIWGTPNTICSLTLLLGIKIRDDSFAPLKIPKYTILYM